MKLKKLNRKDCAVRGDNTPYVTIEKGGIIRINKAVVSALDLKIGDKLNVVHDEDRPKDWYFEKTTDEEGLVMRKHSESGSLCFNAKFISDQIRKTLDAETKTIRFRVATQPIEDNKNLFAILTSSFSK